MNIRSSLLGFFLCSALIAQTLAAQVTIDVRADQSPLDTGIWVEKGETLSLRLTGQWSMWDQWSEVDWRGHRDFKLIDGFPLGTLMASIGGGSAFPLTDGLSLNAPLSGSVILYANRGAYTHLAARGSIRVSLSGGRPLSYEETEARMGWDLAALDSGRDAAYLSAEEKKVLLFLNKARANPPLFAKLYLEGRKGSGAYALECYNEFLAATPRALLRPSAALTSAARDHAKDSGRKGITGHNGSDGSRPVDRVKRYGRFTGSYNGPWENCSYGYSGALDIVLQLLIDDGVPSRGHRKNIMAQEPRFVGLAIEPHSVYKHNCVQDFADSIEDL